MVAIQPDVGIRFRIGGEKAIGVSRPQAQETLRNHTSDIAEYEAKRILAEYGIPVTMEALASTVEDAVTAARRIGADAVNLMARAFLDTRRLAPRPCSAMCI